MTKPTEEEIRTIEVIFRMNIHLLICNNNKWCHAWAGTERGDSTCTREEGHLGPHVSLQLRSGKGTPALEIFIGKIWHD